MVSIRPVVYELEWKQKSAMTGIRTSDLSRHAMNHYQRVAISNENSHTNFGSNPSSSLWVVMQNVRWWKKSVQTRFRTLDLSRHASNPYQSEAIIHVNPRTNFGSNPTNSSRVIAENVRLRPDWDSNLGPLTTDLEPISKCTHRPCLPSHKFWF